MKDAGLYDFKSWPQAGRDQLEEVLLKGKQKFLQDQLLDAKLPIDRRRKMESVLQEIQTRLTGLVP